MRCQIHLCLWLCCWAHCTHSLLCLAFSGACFLDRLLWIPATDSQRLTVILDSRVWRWCPIPWQAESWTWCCSVLPSEPGPCYLVHLPFWILLGMACLWHYRPGVWRYLDKILPTLLWPSPNWFTMSICFKPYLRSPIICHLTYMVMVGSFFWWHTDNKCGRIISQCQVQVVFHKQLANWLFGRWHVAMDHRHFLSVQWTITIALWQKYSKIPVLCADIGNYYNFHTSCRKNWLLWKYAKLLLRCVYKKNAPPHCCASRGYPTESWLWKNIFPQL